MKKLLSTILLVALFINTTTVYATEEGSVNNETNKKIEEVRDQDIFVPTVKGVQRATLTEANKIAEVSKNSLENLSKSYILGDYKTGRILESNNINEVRAMASTSKLVGIYVIMDALKEGTLTEDEMVTIDKECSSLTGSSYKLKENDRVSVKNLLRAALIVSGNDAITSLGKHIAGSTEKFVEMMNDKCKELGLEHAHMVNASGLTDYLINDYNKMTTKEMFILTRELIREYPQILEITSEKVIDEPERNFLEYNTNPILGIVPGIDGLKTGYTNAAGRCLIATGVSEGEEGKSIDTRLIGIVTGASSNVNRYVAAKKLMGEGLGKYKYIVIGSTEEPVTTISVENSSQDEVEVYEKATGSLLWDSKSEIEKEVQIKEGLEAPLPVGEVVGEIIYKINGEEVHREDLILKDRVYQKGFIYRIKYIYEDIFKNINEDAA